MGNIIKGKMTRRFQRMEKKHKTISKKNEKDAK
jgi:hypothetical protein